MRPVGEAEPVEPGQRQQGRVRRAVGQLAEPGLDVAAERHHGEIGADMAHERPPAQRGGADRRARRETGEPAGAGIRVGRDQCVARIGARQHRADRQPVRQPGRHVLHRMHRDVDPPVLEGFLDLLGEQPLAADFGERALQHAVARGMDRLERDRALGPERGIGRGEAAADLVGLGAGERAGACSDPDPCAHRRPHTSGNGIIGESMSTNANKLTGLREAG